MQKFLYLLILALVSINSYAEIIHLKLNSGLNGLAEYIEGDKDKPIVFLLHGILQTKDFSTIKRIRNHLKDEGYSVLTPTLSLGIDSRNKTIDCEAIHTHSMSTDTIEIANWVNWIKNRSKKPIALIGHSAGATQLLAYLKEFNGKTPTFENITLISLAYFSNRPNSKTDSQSIEKAKKSLIENSNTPDSYKFIYCDKYVSLPKAYLSYIKWDKSKVTETLQQESKPINLLFGSGDKRIDQNWPIKLSEMGMNVTIVEGANHFFHDYHEFDLFDYVDKTLE